MLRRFGHQKAKAKKLIKDFEKWEEGAKADLKQGRGFCS